MNWQERLIDLKKNGLTWEVIAKTLSAEYSEEFTHDRVRGWFRRHRGGLVNTVETAIKTSDARPETDKILSMLKSGSSLTGIAETIGVSERVAAAHIEDLSDKGYCIDKTDRGIYSLYWIPKTDTPTVNIDWKGDKIIRFGLLGDTQINSKYTQLTHLHAAYDFYKAEGITDVYHSGDIDEGEQMRPGHQYECYNQGADDHVAEIVRVYPKIDGITTHFITGNHDHSLIKRAGYDIGKAIANDRPDMKYLGQSSAYIKLTPNCTLELRHPLDGTAYAISYKMQKMVEAMSGGEKPNVFAVGHYHKEETLFYRNVHCVQTACLQAQTPWMRGKGISAALGYFIIEIHVDGEGHVTRFKPEFMPFYRAIQDDYKNWR